MTVLELLVALAIVALATVAAANWVRIPDAAPAQLASADFLGFVKEAQIDVLRSGEAQVLVIVGNQATIGTELFTWDGATMNILAEDQVSGPIRIALFPDGTASGPHIDIVTAGASQSVPLIYRAPP
ncbi:MAG: type II secretion system protein [Devosia sp.]